MESWWVTYLLTLLTCQFLSAAISSYSVVKTEIQSSFKISESFFGTIQMFNMLFRLMGSVFLILKPPKKVNLVYCVFATIVSFSNMILVGSSLLPDAAKILIFLALIGTGFGRSSAPLPYILVYKNLQGENSTAFNIWQGLINFGYAWAYLLDYLIKICLGFHWTVYISIFSLILLISTFATYYFVGEVNLSLQQNQEEEKSVMQQIREIKQFLKSFFACSKVSNWLYLFDFIFQQNLSIVILLWLPYYLSHIGFTSNYTIVILAFPIFSVLGSFTLTPALGLFPHLAPKITPILVLLFSICFSSLWLLKEDSSQIFLYFLVVGLGFYFWTVTYSKIATTETAEKVSTLREKYIILNFIRLVRELLSAGIMALCGFSIQKDINNFNYILMGNLLLIMIMHFLRRIKESQEREQKNLLRASDEEINE